MADHSTHTYFGMRVLEELPSALRRRCVGDLSAFRLGLYGPDPLICSFRTKSLSDHLHHNWREVALPDLQRAMRQGGKTGCSFSAGCFLHFVLDDIVHPEIYQWMTEGSSHFRLELALGNLILDEEKIDKVPRLVLQGMERTAQAAAAYLRPTDKAAYLTGLRRMAALTALLRSQNSRAVHIITDNEWSQALQLRHAMEENVAQAAGWLEEMLAS